MSAVDLAEIYSPARFGRKCAMYGLRPGFAIDLTTRKPDGDYWDLSKPKDVELLETLQEEEKPFLLIGSPPCTTFSQLLKLSHTEAEMQARQEKEGKPHMRVAAAAYRRQLEDGRHFLHEHPAGSSAWLMPEIQQLIKDERCFLVQVPMCRWEMDGRCSSPARSVG
jgi:hypothetical protein